MASLNARNFNKRKASVALDSSAHFSAARFQGSQTLQPDVCILLSMYHLVVDILCHAAESGQCCAKTNTIGS
jgi:hypothetical protein